MPIVNNLLYKVHTAKLSNRDIPLPATEAIKIESLSFRKWHWIGTVTQGTAAVAMTIACAVFPHLRVILGIAAAVMIQT